MIADEPIKAVINETNRIINQGLSKGIGQVVPAALNENLENNIFLFSGFKTYQSLKEVSSLLKDENGGIKPYYKFQQEVLKIDSTYNKTYLNVEYNYAIASAQMAAKWAEYEADGDEYNLQYLTANDGNVRDEHAAMEGITLPPSDPFWKSYFPPNGWGCRCTVLQVLKDKYQKSDPKNAMATGDAATKLPSQKIFRFNPGIEQHIFPDKHPYYKVSQKASDKIKAVVNAEKISAEEKKVLSKDEDFSPESEDDKRWFENRDKVASELGLSEAEKSVVSRYSRNLYYDINSRIYADERLPAYEKAAKNTLNRALEKLPKYEGTVYRGVSKGISEERLKQYKDAAEKGGTITEKAFISTSKDKKIANLFEAGKGVAFEIKTKTGRDIKDFSVYNGNFYGSDEKEVLIGNNKKFKVIKYVVNNNGGIEIGLEEI